LPVELVLGDGDVRLALLRVVSGEGLEGELGFAADFGEDFLGEFEHGEFAGVSDVDGRGLTALHEADEAFDEVIDVAEGAGLSAVAVYRNILATKGLNDEVGDDASVIGVHAGAVGVKDPDDADVHAVLAVVVHEEGLGGALALVVAGADANGVHIPPVGLWLWVHGGVAIDL